MVVTTYGCIKNHASRSAFLYNVNNKRLGLPVVFNTVAKTFTQAAKTFRKYARTERVYVT